MGDPVRPAAFACVPYHYLDASPILVPNLGKILQMIFLLLPFLPGIFFLF